MKKTILSLSLIVLAITAANAQVQFGLKAGLNISSYNGTNSSLLGPGKEGKPGFNGGGLVNISLSKSFSLQPEVVYSEEGTRADVGSSAGGAEFDINYINIPLLLKYNITKGFAVEAGPQAGLLASAIAKPYETGESAINAKSLFNTMSYSLDMGVSYLTDNNLGFDARYNLGLSKNLLQGSDNPFKMFGTVFQVGAYYMFGK